MTAKDIITILVPVLVAVVTGLYAYLQTRKTSGVEGQKLNLASFEILNKSQAAELERIRADRDEDQKAAKEQRQADQAEIESLRQQLFQVRDQCETEAEHFSDLVRWTRQITRIFNDPGLIRILSASDVHIPPPPTWPGGP